MKRNLLSGIFLLLLFVLTACRESSESPNIPTESTPAPLIETSVATTEPSLHSPFDSATYIGMNYSEVENLLRKAGFAELEFIPIDDIQSDSDIADGTVVSVRIDGLTEYTSSHQFDENVPVVIAYHNIPKVLVPLTSNDAINTHYMDVGRMFFDAGFSRIETDEVYDLPADSEFKTILTTNNQPIENNMLLPFDQQIHVIGHYPLPEYSVQITIDFEANWIFNKYDVVSTLNGEKLGVMPHGEDAVYNFNLPSGTYTLAFANAADPNVSGSIDFEIICNTVATYRIICNSDEVGIKEKVFTQDLSDSEFLIPFSSNHYLRKDYQTVMAELETLGFTKITAKPVADHLWYPSDVNSTVRVIIDNLDTFERDQKFSKESEVLVYYHVADFKFLQTSISVTEKDTFELDYTLSSGDSIDSLVFEIDHPEILQRNEDGTYTALNPGTAVITVSSGGNICSSCTVEISEIIVPIDSITFETDNMDVVVGSTFSLNYKICPENANYTDITIETSSDGIIQNDDQTFYVDKSGDTEILFYQDDRLLGYCVVHATVIGIENLTFVEAVSEIFIGESCKLSFVLQPENATCKGIRVESSNIEVADVVFNERGTGTIVVNGISAGVSTITITLPNGAQYTHTITVNEIDPTEILISNTAPDTKIEVGTPIALSVIWVPENTSVKELTWSSSNKEIIKVNSDGTLEAIGVGNADITATHKSGMTGTISLTVEPTIVTGIVLNTCKEELTKGDKFTISGYVVPKNATTQTLTFASTDESVVKVSDKGVVTAVGIGTATIRVTSPDGPTEKVEVTVKPTPQKFKIKWSASLVSNDHVGSSWSKYFELNNEKFKSGSTFTLSPDSSFTVCLTIEENDSRPDTGYYSERIWYSEDLCKNGYTISDTVYVRENGGRYSGNVAEWKIKITITPVN